MCLESYSVVVYITQVKPPVRLCHARKGLFEGVIMR